MKQIISASPETVGVPGTFPACGCAQTWALVYCFSAPASWSCRIWLTVSEEGTWALRNSAASPSGPCTNRSSALEVLDLLHPEGSDTDATELDAVWQPAHAGGVVVVVAGPEVVVVADPDVVVVAEPEVVVVAEPDVVEVTAPEVVVVTGPEVVGGVVGGSVVVPAGAVVGVGDVVAGLAEVVVVLPGAALGTVVGLVWCVSTLGTTRPATTASTNAATTATPMATGLSRPRGPGGGAAPGATA